MLEARGVWLSFPGRERVTALRAVDLAVEGGVTAVLGASGSGKTTLLRVLAGFLRPDAGEVWLDGRLLSGPGAWVRPERRGIGVVPQEGALFPHLDVAGNVGFGLGLRRDGRARRVARMLALVGLEGFERRRPDELSGGQQQRVALARALLPEPGVVLLDEPFSAVDASVRAELGQEVCGLLRKLGTTAVLVTHDQAEALSLADRVVVMREGEVVQVAPPERLYASPADPETAAFVGEAVLLPGRVRDPERRHVVCALGEIALREPAPGDSTAEACTVLLRPEQLQLAPAGVPARVSERRFFGHDALLTVCLDDGGESPPLLVRTPGIGAPEPGTSVSVAVRGEATLYTAAPS